MMANIYTTPSGIPVAPAADPASAPAISWAAIIAGAVGAASIALVLVIVGAGLGLASISPFSNSGVSGSTFTIATGVILLVIHAASAGVGGYIAGRLRTRWTGLHSDEVFFRDTAHGFLSWALGTLLGAMLLTSAVSSILGAGAQAGATVASGATQGLTTGLAAGMSGGSGGNATSGASAADPTSYYVDMLFRTDRPSPDANDQASRTEVGRILANAVRNGELPAADRTYLAQVVANRTGVPQADAERRIDDTVKAAQTAAKTTADKAKQTAETARKAASYTSLWMAAAMLFGAFFASICATWGGHSRDS